MATSLKCVTVGDGAVGKTCLLVTYTTDKFPGDYIPTIFDNYMAQIMHKSAVYMLCLWDTAGQEDYSSIRTMSYPDTDVFLVCFSVVSRTSFQNLKSKWLPEITKKSPGVPFIIVGLKSDLREREDVAGYLKEKGTSVVSKEEAEKAAKEFGAYQYVECSSLTQKNVGAVFSTLVEAVVDGGEEKKRKGCQCTIM